MPSQEFVGRLRRADIFAMRHLPPYARLNELTQLGQRELRATLLELPDDVDPIRWLTEERPDLAVRIALWTYLMELRWIIPTSRQVRSFALPTPPETPGLLRGLSEAPEALLSFALLDGESGDSRPILSSLLRELRFWRDLGIGETSSSHQNPPRGGFRQSPEDPGVAYFWASASALITDEPLWLYHELLNSPRSADPMDWLQERHLDRAVRTAIRKVVERSLPERSQMPGAVVRTIRLAQTLVDQEYMQVVLDEVILGTEGFQIITKAKWSDAIVQKPAGVDMVMAVWSGFNQAVDDLGNS